MKVQFNGETLDWDLPCLLSDFLQNKAEQDGFNLDQVVVAVNQNFIHKNDYHAYELQADDNVEMLMAVVGG